MKENWPERRQRHAVRLDATVTRGDGTEVPAVVTDLSLDGCCLSGSFRIGEELTVKLPKIGALPGTIRWSFLGRAGVRFTSNDSREGTPKGAQ